VVTSFSVLFVAQGLLAAPSDSGIDGTVRAVEDRRALAGAIVEVLDASSWTITDSTGHYRIDGLRPGEHPVRFRMLGREPLQLTARVPSAGTIRLDVELLARPMELPPLVAIGRRAPAPRSLTQPEQHHPAPLSPIWALRAVPGFEDLRSALVADPTAAIRGDGGGTLHLGGGSADQVLLTLDGFPVYGANHFGDAWSGINPDVVQDVAVQPAGTPGEDMGRLSGTVAVRTSLLGGDAALARGAANPNDVRQLVRADLDRGRVSFLLSGRRSIRNFFVTGAALDGGNGYDDWLATASMQIGSGRLRALSYRSGNRLSFESRADTLPFEGAATGDATSSGAPAASVLNNLLWASHTDGLVWETTNRARSIGVMGWRAGSATEADWWDPNRPIGVESRFDELGLRAQATWFGHGSSTSAGVALRKLETGYRARPASSGAVAPSTVPSVDVQVAPTVLSTFVRHQWRWTGILMLDAGLQGAAITSGWTGVDPQLSVQVRPAANLTGTVSAGRSHQFTQSLSNEESFLGTILGLELPAAAAGARVPVARADNLTAAVQLGAGRGLTLAVDGYARRFHDLLLAAPSSRQPFVSGAVGTGSGSATGVSARVGFARGPVELAASVGIARASRVLGSTSYTPGFRRARFARATLVVRPDDATSLGLSLTAGSGQSATPVTGLDWRPNDPLAGEGELAGTPTNLAGPINASLLPAMQRVDIGLRREWRLHGWTPGRGVTTAITVENLFNYPNALSLSGNDSGGDLRLVRARPRGVRLELGWGF
jgi:hypothetical protein